MYPHLFSLFHFLYRTVEYAKIWRANAELNIGRYFMYDIIVIGAGPAGAAAAKTLAENGCRVLLAEKCRIPRYKSCSGQLIQKSLNLVERYFGEPVPSHTTCSPAENRGMVFTDDTGHTYVFPQPGLNVWRSSFDAWLTKKAAAAGAVVQDALNAVSCTAQDGAVLVRFRRADGSLYDERAEYVIDCEGVAGVIKRQLTGTVPDGITTYQTFHHGRIDLDPHYFYAYLQPELSEYDAWFNVKDGMLVLGVSVKNKEKEPYYYDSFLSYMKKHHGLSVGKPERVDRWLMPRIKPGCAICYGIGRVLFAGEAAGFLNPMGEGISAGLESAYSAAQAVLKHRGDTEGIYSSYREGTAALHDYMKRQWNLVGGMAKTFSEMKQP